MLLALYFVVVIALPTALGIYVALNGMQRSRRCPSCGEETLWVRSHLHRLLSKFFPSGDVQLRWCATCSWQGAACVSRSVPHPHNAPPVAATERGSEQVEIREIQIDGRAWSVMLDCWAEEGRWLGRFFFRGPGGRACMEEEPSIEGQSAIEVLSSALATPDANLAGRIRRATTK
jgi:predicted RNA-binding Zn-ribbon protein involved in translation (DUF1610 family)